MVFMHKFFSFVFLYAASLYFLGCAPTPPPVEENALVHKPISQLLTKTDSSRMTSASLKCGCPFKIIIDGYGGETAVIHYTIPTAAQDLSSHTITIASSPSGLAIKTYTSWLAISTPDPNVAFLRDTVRDTLIVN